MHVRVSFTNEFQTLYHDITNPIIVILDSSTNW